MNGGMKRGEIARNVTRGAFFLAVEKVAALISGMVYFALMLRWLGPTIYGILTLATSVTGFAAMLTLNFEVFLERYAAEYESRGRLDLVTRALGLSMALKVGLGLVASAVVLGLAPHLATQFNVPQLTELLPVMVAMVACDGLYTTGRSLLFGIQRFEWVGGLSLIFHIAKTVMVGLLWWSKQGLMAMAFGLTVITVVQAVLFAGTAWFIMSRAPRTRRTPEQDEADGPMLRQMMGYCLPLLGARAAFISGQNLGKLVLAKFIDATQLGYFTFAFQTIERFVELVYALPSVLLPSLTHLVAREERERLAWVFEEAFRLVQVAACAVAWGVFTFSPELTRYIGSPLFMPSLGMLQVLALVPIARTAQQPLTMMFQAMRRPGVVFALALVKLGVELSCYFLFVKRLGGLGAAYANLAGAVTSYLVALVLGGFVIPELAWRRAGAVVRALMLTLPMLGVSMLIMQDVPSLLWSITLRALLMVPALLAILALGLVTSHDLEKLSSLKVREPWLARLRDVVVGATIRVALVFEPRRPA